VIFCLSCRFVLRFVACIHCVSSVIGDTFYVVAFYYMFMRVSCFGLVVSTCQVISYRKTPVMTPFCGEEIISKNPRLKRFFVYFFLAFSLFMLLRVFFQPCQRIDGVKLGQLEPPHGKASKKIN